MSYKRTIAILNKAKAMTSGHLDEEPAPKRQVQDMLGKHPDLQAYLAGEPIISREFRVPYLGGISKDGKTVYIDRNLPAKLPKTGIAPGQYIALHERAEWWLMTRLGMDYLGRNGTYGGHPYAVRIEHDALEDDGEDPDAYENELATYIKEDESARYDPEELPPDLFLGPYEDDQDSLDRKLLPFLRAAAVRSTGRKLGHAIATYGPGHSPEFCRNCKHFDRADKVCEYVVDVEPAGWCILWSR